MQNEINHFLEERKNTINVRQKCLMFSFSNFRKYVMHDVMHARKIFNVFFYFPKSFKKKWKYAMQNEIDVFLFSKIILKKKENM